MKRTLIALILILAAGLLLNNPSPALAQSPTPDPLSEHARAYILELSNSDFQAASQRYDASVAKPTLPDELQAAWASLIQNAGAFKGIASTVPASEGEYRIVYVITELEKANVDIKVVFNQGGKIVGMGYLPGGSALAISQPYQTADYVDPGSFTEQEVTVGSSEWPLPGVLLLPKGAGPFPAVVLVAGSGPNDRDETIGSNKPLKDLAEGLASRGIASLRYDKRTKAHPQKIVEIVDRLTVKDEVTDDALAAIDQLRQTPGIDPKKIFVLGHSLGGMLAPRIAATDPSLAGIIILAGPTRPLEDIIVDQYTYLYNLDGSISPEEQANLEKFTAAAERVKDPGLSDDAAPEDLPLGVPAAYWLDLRDYNPAATAKQLDMPILSLRGERDYQVNETDFTGWQTALSDQPKAVLKQYPGLNHLFIFGKGTPSPDEYTKAGHVSKTVIEDISDFIYGKPVNTKPPLIKEQWSTEEITRLVLLLVPIWLIQIGVNIYALLDLKTRTTTRGPRWLWAVLLIVSMFMMPTGLIVSAIYLIWGRKDADDDAGDTD